MGHASLALDRSRCKTRSFPIGKIEVFWRGCATKNTTTFSAYTETAGRLFEKFHRKLNDANDHWNYVFRKTRHGNIFGSFLWGYLGVLFPNGTTKDGIPTPKSTPPTASVVSPPAWCNYLKWKMTPLPWCRVDSGKASCSHLGFFLGGPSCRKNLVPPLLGVFFAGKKPQTWTPNDSPK